jgi:serine O-acetyltransferase
MSQYERGTTSDAAVARASAALVTSMRGDVVTRLRASGTPGPGGGEGGVAESCEGGFRAANVAHVRALLDDLRRLMFPGYFDPDPLWDGELEAHVTRLCARIARALEEELRAVMRYGRRPGQHGGERVVPEGLDGEAYVRRVVEAFLGELPGVRGLLALDVRAAYDGDPAAENTDEIILCYPGLEAIFVHRVAHVLYRLGVPVLARVMSERAHSATGIDIHPGAQIGESFFIDHGSATVIGETSVIGRQVKVYQGVTLGARSFPRDERGRVIRGIKRHPTIGDRVTIYAGAVILGGDTTIGDDSVIAGGVFVTASVPPGHVVQQTRPELVLRPAPGARPSPAPKGSAGVGWLGDGAGI